MSLVTLVSVSLSFYVYNYAFLTQGTRARSWDFGYKEMISYVDSQGFERVVIDDPWTEAYIHYLFFTRKDPEIYQRAVTELEKPENYYYSDSSEIRPARVANYEFREVNWPSERGDSGTVFVFWKDRLPESEFITDPKVEFLKEVRYPDGEVAYRIVKIK